MVPVARITARQSRGKYAAEGRSGFIGEFMKHHRRLLWNQERVATTERSNVEEGQYVLVLVNLVARDFSIEYF